MKCNSALNAIHSYQNNINLNSKNRKFQKSKIPKIENSYNGKFQKSKVPKIVNSKNQKFQKLIIQKSKFQALKFPKFQEIPFKFLARGHGFFKSCF